MTNDFVALLKDSSLVSVITVVELTKQTSIFAANIGSWVVPGVLCAAMYLVLSLPLARLARRHREADVASGMTVLDVSRSATCDVAARPVVQRCLVRRRRAARCVALMGASGAGQDDRAAGDCGTRADRRGQRGHRWPAAVRRTLAARRDASRAAPARRHGVSVPSPVRASHRAPQRLAGAGARAAAAAAPRPSARHASCSTILGVGASAGRACRTSCRAERRSAWRLPGRWPSSPPVLLMDEPTASLDPARRGELAATLRQLAAEGRTLVVATHDDEFARACADRVLDHGRGPQSPAG